MKHPERVEDYLAHITEAVERATSYVKPLPDIEAFRQNPLVQDGVVRNIEIIGEAATQISRMAPEFIAQHPELPWSEMRRMRNIVVHAYFAVNLNILRQTVHEDLPVLKQQIDELLKQGRANINLAERFGRNAARNLDVQPEKDAERDHNLEHEL